MSDSVGDPADDIDVESPTIGKNGAVNSGKEAGRILSTSYTNDVGDVAEKPGDSLGPYQLIEKIGEGGFGVVYLAEQRVPIERSVALKIIKPGMDTEEVITRFEAERQALALMDHPGVASVFDAGATAAGRPFFVMELVKGLTVTDYCNVNRLNTRQRLRLFQSVCNGVQHAHQKGVIHRDLKPSNILVTEHDGEAAVKIIDFGIAKSIGQSLSRDTMFTAYGQLMGTPQYMSPEQSDINAIDIDTRSDIYSLGVVLYELLTGKTPFDPKALRRAGWEEIIRILREDEPPKPSTKLNSLSGKETDNLAQTHSEPQGKTSRIVKGDLDWIVMKALDKDRKRRYETANEFAADLQRYLDDKPVEACPPSAGYRLGKYARRNKAVLTTAMIVFCILIAAVAVSSWQAVVAHRAKEAEEKQRARAEAKAEEAIAVLSFLEDHVLAAARPKDQNGGLGIDVTIKEAIDSAEPKVGDSFSGHPLVEASIRFSLGSTYNSLSEPEKAIEQGNQALKIRTEELGPRNEDTLEAMNNLGIALDNAGRYHEALSLHETTLTIRKAELGLDHLSTLTSMTNLASSLNNLGRFEEALNLNKIAFEKKKKLVGAEDPSTLVAMINMSTYLIDFDRFDEALILSQETFDLCKKILGENHPHTLDSMGCLATTLHCKGRFSESIALRKRALKIEKRVLGEDHFGTLSTMNNLATSLRSSGQIKEALEVRERTLGSQRVALGIDHPKTVLSALRLVESHIEMGQPTEAADLVEKEMPRIKKLIESENSAGLEAMHYLANFFHHQGLNEESFVLRQKSPESSFQGERAVAPGYTTSDHKPLSVAESAWTN